MKMSSESSYGDDQFNVLSHKLYHHTLSTNKSNQKLQLHLFTTSPDINAPSSISKMRSQQRQSYPILLNPSPALIMKPEVTSSSVNFPSNTSQSCLPTITRTGKEIMSQNSEKPKLMTSAEAAVSCKVSQRKHISSLSPSSSPTSTHYSTCSTQYLPSLSSSSIYPYRRPLKSKCSKTMFASSCKLLLVVLLYYMFQACNCECEKSFDAVFCDLPDSYSNGARSSSVPNSINNRGSYYSQDYEQPSALPFLSTSVTSGYGFKSGNVWSLECVSSDEINVLKNSMKPFVLPNSDRHSHGTFLSAAISDGETYYLIQNHLVYMLNVTEGSGPDLSSLRDPRPTWEIFDDYKGIVKTGFHFRSKLYLFDGVSFHIYTQKSYRRSGIMWNWSSHKETSSRLVMNGGSSEKDAEDPRGNLTSVFTVKSADAIGETDIVLVYDNAKYYKFSLNQCLMSSENNEFFHERCFWKDAKQTVDLFDCIWISWQILAAIITILLMSLLVIGYCCFCIICYRKKRRSGTFRHEKQSHCCPESDHSSDCCDAETEEEPLKGSLSLDQVDGGEKKCRDGLSLLPGGLVHPSAVNGGLSNGSSHHHHHHHIIECGEKDALTGASFGPSDLDMESETGSTVGVSCYNEDRLSINLEESNFGKYGNRLVYNSTTTNTKSQSNLTQYHHHHINLSNGAIKQNGN